MARHLLAAAAAFAVVAVECAGGLPPQAEPPVAHSSIDHLAAPSALGADEELQASQRDAPAPAAPGGPAPAPVASADDEPEPLPETVEVVRPAVRADGVGRKALEVASALEGVEDVVMVGTVELKAATPDGLEPLTALVVDTPRFRSFTPDVTANEVGVWQRLQEGNIVPTAAVANAVEAKLGEPLTLSGDRGSESLRIGALAANGLPQLADVMIPADVADRLVTGTGRTLLVAVEDDAKIDGVTKQLKQSLDGEVDRLVEPVAREVTPNQVGRTTLESFTYQSVGDGTIRIDGDWVARNIVTAEVPLLGRVTCHRAVIPQLRAALADVQAAGLADQIYQYSGCWVPRHILWDPSKGISRHAWGLAFDINVPTNQYGANPQMNRQIVQIFRDWGFAWGGDWSTPDGMHFELERIVRP